MRNVVLEAAITLDGYIARPDGSVDYLFTPKGFSLEPFFKSIDVVIMGRKTYEVGLKLGGFAMFKIPCYIMTHSMPEREEENLRFTHQSPRELVTELRKQKGKDIWLMGGGELTRSFLQEDLVDELSFGVVPFLLGEGVPMFPSGFPQRDFTLLESKAYSGGFLRLKYRRDRKQHANATDPKRKKPAGSKLKKATASKGKKKSRAR